MLTEALDSLVVGLKITHCCCCFNHQGGVQVLGIIYASCTVISLGATLVWSFALKDACHGPVFVSRHERCVVNLDEQTQFKRELVKISNYLKDFKPSFLVFLITVVVGHLITFLCSVLLTFGSLTEKKVLMIPWLILTKIWILFFLVATVFIIYLEGRLYNIGTTVFGLFSLGTIFLACLLGYFWMVVQALYIRLEQMDFSTYEVQNTVRNANVHINRAFNTTSLENLDINSIKERYEIIVDDASLAKGDLPMKVITSSSSRGGVDDVVQVSRL